MTIVNLCGNRIRPTMFNTDYVHLSGISRELSRLSLRFKGKRVLDIGCGDLPYKELFADTVYVPCDIPGNNQAMINCFAEDIKAVDCSFDVVLSTQILEHVIDPVKCMREFYRVLAPGGVLVLSTHGVFPWHPCPVDYWRWTSQGLEKLAVDAGFKGVRIIPVGGGPSVPLQLMIKHAESLANRFNMARYLLPFTFCMNLLSVLVDRFFNLFYHGQENVGLTMVYVVEAYKGV